MSVERIGVAVIEDDPVTRVGLAAVIDNTPSLRLSVTAASVEEFERSVDGTTDVVLLDLWLRGGGVEGPQGVQRLRERGLKVLVVSMSEEETPVLDAISAGAHGYLTKEAEPAEIGRAVTVVAQGRTYLSPTVAGYLLKDRIRLTDREREVLRLVASGETTSDIAKMLFIAEKTVNGHLERIRDKTGYRRRADLTRLAYDKGIMRSAPRRRPEGGR